MSLFSSRLPTILLIFSLFNLEGVLGRGRESSSGAGDDPDASSGDLNHLPPALNTVVVLRIFIALGTLSQLGSSLKRFTRLHLPEGDPTLRYETGMLSRILLTSYTVIYILFNILHAVLVSSLGGTFHLPDGFPNGSALTSQSAIVLFYATLLSVIAYRQRIQLNPAQNVLNLKTVLDGTLLATILTLGIAQVALLPRTGLNPDDPEDSGRIAVLENLFVAFQVFVFLTSLNVAISSFMARARLSKANIRDRVVTISAFAVSPIVICGAIFGIVNIGIEGYLAPSLGSGNGKLLIAATVIEGVVSIGTVSFCLLMTGPFKLSSLFIC